jgi:hypothetical protein
MKAGTLRFDEGQMMAEENVAKISESYDPVPVWRIPVVCSAQMANNPE